MNFMKTGAASSLLKIAFFLSSLSLLGAHCGAPTEFTKEREREKSPCALECDRGTRDGDVQGKAICLRACEAKNELEREKK